MVYAANSDTAPARESHPARTTFSPRVLPVDPLDDPVDSLMEVDAQLSLIACFCETEGDQVTAAAVRGVRRALETVRAGLLAAAPGRWGRA